jgi:hypothetical protein
LDCARHWALGR